jgi:GNAT superfamily N-acetyltransferase
MEIRPASEEDLDDVADMLGRAYGEYAPLFPGAEAFQEYLDNLVDVRARRDEAQLWIAELDGAVAGSLDYYAPGETPYHTFAGFPVEWAAFRFLGTDPEVRGAGVGRALVEWVIGHAREDGAPYLGLHTGPFMVTAKAMYERMGFERSPEQDFFPVPDQDMRVMAYRMAL